MQRAVLIVDEGVDVSDVGLVDQFRGWLVVGWGPSAEFDVVRQLRCEGAFVGGDSGFG